MPRTLRLRDDRTIVTQRPMESSPATAGIRNHKNETYLVFMDETFRPFFELERPMGYLCYSAVGIPENEYAYVTRALTRIFAKYEGYLVGDSGIHLREFKFEDFKKLQRDQREEIAGQIGKTIKLAGGFIIGFYTHVVGIVMERVRTNLVGEQAAVPEDHKSLYEQAAEELRGELGGVESQIIGQILE